MPHVTLEPIHAQLDPVSPALELPHPQLEVFEPDRASPHPACALIALGHWRLSVSLGSRSGKGGELTHVSANGHPVSLGKLLQGRGMGNPLSLLDAADSSITDPLDS